MSNNTALERAQAVAKQLARAYDCEAQVEPFGGNYLVRLYADENQVIPCLVKEVPVRRPGR